MSNAEKEALAAVIMGMNEDEKAFITKYIPAEYMLNELVDRTVNAMKVLQKVEDIYQNSKDQTLLLDMQKTISELKAVLK